MTLYIVVDFPDYPKDSGWPRKRRQRNLEEYQNFGLCVWWSLFAAAGLQAAVKGVPFCGKLQCLPMVILPRMMMRRMKLTSGFQVTLLLAFTLSFTTTAFPQLGMFSTQQRIALTREWKGERFPDGRPKAPDSVLEGLKDVDAEEATGALWGHGYTHQFAGGWREINPGERMVGRVFTAVFMPLRPDVNAAIDAQGKAEGRVGAQNAWPIDLLSPGDVLVVDLFGKIQDGTYAGDKLSTAIFAKSHNGLVVDGAVRSETAISEIKGMHVFVRNFDPSALNDVMLMGINVPIRIGHVTVLPGDVAVSDVERDYFHSAPIRPGSH